MLTTIAVVAGLAIGTLAWLRSQRTREAAPARTSARIPARTGPQQRVSSATTASLARRNPATRATLVRLQAANGCCRDAQLLGEHTINAAFAPALPLVGCGRVDCSCRYERLPDSRRAERRIAIDRRDAIRFQDSRRRRPDRRMPNTVWDQAL